MFINTLTDLAIILQSALNVSVSGTLESISEAVIALVEEQKKLEEMEMETETDHDNLLDEISELKSVYNQRIEDLLDKVEKETGVTFNSNGLVVMSRKEETVKVETDSAAIQAGNGIIPAISRATMAKTVTLSPAYGRDYRSKKSVLSDFDKNKDFIIEDYDNTYCGKPVNRSQLIEAGYKTINFRYTSLQRVSVITL